MLYNTPLPKCNRWRLAGFVFALLLCWATWAAAPVMAQTVTRGPYLQMGTPNSVVVRWRTSMATDSRVRYGADQATLTAVADNATSTTEHVVTVSGLTPQTRYYYSIGSTTQTLVGGDANHFFFTPPSSGTEQSTHIWVIGDAGTANANAQAVQNAYLSHKGSQYTHLWLMLGDNAYDSGTDSEYQTAVFNMYPSLLRQTVLWPTLGNHDGATADSSTQTGPYYAIFTLPKNAEAGGLASGTEAYYSFDYGNIHFVVLDSYETSRASNGAMLNWLRNDLAATTQTWIIAFWHHPPYTKGSHDSDAEIELIEMRTNALPILEAAGVDLVLTGHSHSYERSFLIDGHYGNSSTFTASMKIDGGNGHIDGDGEYQKPDGDPTSNAGTVYAVAGSSGQISGGTLNHPAMFISLNVLGSMILEVNGPFLDATFLSSTGVVRDYFGIVKASSGPPTVTVSATDATATEAGSTTGTFNVRRTGSTTAALPVHYTVGGSATAGSDYTVLAGTVTILAGTTAATMTVTPVNDALVEANETVMVTLATSVDYSVGTPNSATVTITSDDTLPTVSLSASDATATEAGPTTGTFTVSRTGSTTAALTVNYTVGGNATAGSDYTALAGTVTIASAATSATITVTPIDDTVLEGNETVIATLAANAAYSVGTPSSATVTITSDETLPTVSLSASDATATEAGATTGTFTVSRTGSTTAALTVNYTVSGSATAGSDYTALAGTVTILSGASSATITVTPIDDTVGEANETVVATLASSAGYTIGSPSSATVTISSDESVPATNVSLNVSSIYDNKTGKTYQPGGPDGADPYNDINSLAEEFKVELEAGTSYWWQAFYQDPPTNAGNPSAVTIIVEYRSEVGWTGTFTAQYRNNSAVLATANLPVNSSNDPVMGKGQKGHVEWNLSTVVTSLQNLTEGQVRFINQSTNGKKIWVSYSFIKATLGGTTTAKATDNSGASTMSAAANLTVTAGTTGATVSSPSTRLAGTGPTVAFTP